MTPDTTQEPIVARFTPVPLVAGDHLAVGDTFARIASVTVTITCADGTTEDVALVEQYGGWWAPPERT